MLNITFWIAFNFIGRMLNCLRVFNHFVGLALKELSDFIPTFYIISVFYRDSWTWNKRIVVRRSLKNQVIFVHARENKDVGRVQNRGAATWICFAQKTILKYFVNLIGKHCVGVSFLKLCRPTIYQKRGSDKCVFPWILKIFKNSFLQNNSRQLVLKLAY